ncbi:MAG: hypothetical protein H6585_14940 [Flavobacteriales bacterium]|nr:hypothetical protein [Flavobacteriales bacterium]
MNKIATTICALAISLSAFAQAPEKMSYQAVIRDAGNVLVTNQNVGMQISILQGAPNGTPVYVETQMPMSNLNGLVTIEIGAGSVVSGAFNTIDWSNGPYFIKTETDPVGGTSYSIMGTSELLSVPYALHAKTAESISGTIPELDPVFMNSIVGSITTMDTANWNHHTIDTDTHLTESEVDAFVSNNGYLTSEVDGSVTNEIQSLSLSNDTLYLSGGGSVKLPAGFDGDFTNLSNIPSGLSDGDDDTHLTESEVDAFVSNNGYLTSEVDGSVTNEIQSLSLSNDTLYLSDGGSVKLPAGFDGDFTNLSNIPSGLSDGDDDTHLTESEVDAFVSNNGYLTSEVDGSVTNEIQTISRSGTTVTLSNGGGSFTDSVNVYTAGTGIDITNNVVSATASSKNILYLTADSVLTSSDDMLVFIDGAYKVTMPASPANGQEIVLCTKNGSASIDANTGRVFQIALTTFASLTFTTGSTNMYRCIYSSDLDTWFILYT